MACGVGVSDDVGRCCLVRVEWPGQQFLGVAVIDLDPESALQEEARTSVGSRAARMSLAVHWAVVLLAAAGRLVAVAGLDNKPAADSREPTG